MTILTERERDILNSAEYIIRSHTKWHASWHCHGAWYDFQDAPGPINVTYFTTSRVHHSNIAGETLADKIQTALDIQDGEDPDQVRIDKIAKLKAELASLGA